MLPSWRTVLFSTTNPSQVEGLRKYPRPSHFFDVMSSNTLFRIVRSFPPAASPPYTVMALPAPRITLLLNSIFRMKDCFPLSSAVRKRTPVPSCAFAQLFVIRLFSILIFWPLLTSRKFLTVHFSFRHSGGLLSQLLRTVAFPGISLR